MKAQDFRAWRFKMDFNRSQAAAALGLSRNQPQRWEDANVDDIPDYIALACAALLQGIKPYEASQADLDAVFNQKMFNNSLGIRGDD